MTNEKPYEDRMKEAEHYAHDYLKNQNFSLGPVGFRIDSMFHFDEHSLAIFAYIKDAYGEFQNVEVEHNFGSREKLIEELRKCHMKLGEILTKLEDKTL